MNQAPRFDDALREELDRLLRRRRGVRHLRPDPAGRALLAR